MPSAPALILVTGVSGSGKSTVARELARRTGWVYLDADDYHPAANREKMSAGIPLTDTDRLPWLESLVGAVRGHAGHPVVLACSALKESYRELFRKSFPDVRVVHLKGTREQILRRMRERRGHFMKAGMLDSQFADLEEPEGAIVLDITPPAGQIVGRILADLEAPSSPSTP